MVSHPPDRSRYQRVKAILFEALEQEESVRREWIEGACAEDPELLREVESLLAAYACDDDFLERRPALGHATDKTPEPEPPPALPDSVGRYGILRLLGWGGMGVVYLAEQDHPRRRVALKVLRMDCVEASARRRFQREAEALGRLHHPGIAQVFEAGVTRTDAGPQPYFAMEYIEDAASIREHCRRGQLSLILRFELMARVCEAVHHAHTRGVLHRDLKPDNVLIDTEGQPKVLDFGVARLTESAADSFFTRTGQILGTVAYMSPEQARGGDADERSDQFSLGVILYELLTGRLPFDTRGESLPQMMRSVAEDDPYPIASVNPELSGDAATIVHKALDPDPARRYPTVESFAHDIQRYLEGRPIEARPPTTLYQLQKLVARHRVLTASVVAVIAALCLGLGFALHGMREARAAERRASLESEQVLRLSHVQLLEELERRETLLWPPGPDLVAALDDWLADADELRRSLPEHRRHLKELQASEREGRLGEVMPHAEVVRGGVEWYLAKLEALVEDLRGFFSEPDGLVPEIRARRRLSAELVERTVADHRPEWDAAIAAIQTLPVYRGLVIEPQVGLVPLGPDPESGLWEFAHYGQTGVAPVRDPETGRLAITEETGVVFVLLPGGSCLVGAQGDDPQAPNYYALAGHHHGPPRRLELDPFLLAKYELTQAQWVRVEGRNPSHWQPGEDPGAAEITWLHPVETVSWEQAQVFVYKLGCTLPTEAQWEYGARGGTETPWWTGADVNSLRGKVNVASRVRVQRGVVGLPGEVSEDGTLRWDGWPVHAPIGTYPPNPYGLHEVLGNVAELCQDGYKVHYHALELREGDGLVLEDAGGDITFRGGSFGLQPWISVSWRTEIRAYDSAQATGFRITRALSGDLRFGEKTRD